MAYPRLTDLISENNPREGYGIMHGDVVRFPRANPAGTPREERMTEGFIRESMTTKQDGYGRDFRTGITDEYGRPAYLVEDADGNFHRPIASDCFRVDPPFITEK